MVGQEAQQFAAWLEADGILQKLDPYSHAYCALPTQQAVILTLNNSVRTCRVLWYENQDQWPEDDWIIGEMGNGDYYFVSRSNQYSGVWQYHHELRMKEPVAQSLREFYEFCVKIERDAGHL